MNDCLVGLQGENGENVRGNEEEYYHSDEGGQTGTNFGRELGAGTLTTSTGTIQAEVLSKLRGGNAVVDSVKESHCRCCWFWLVGLGWVGLVRRETEREEVIGMKEGREAETVLEVLSNLELYHEMSCEGGGMREGGGVG